jgi:transglutaminase-like putative cysteine protease
MTESIPAIPERGAATPPFLLPAALLLWGWQSGVPLVGAGAGVALESARFIPARWDLTEEDFRRVWNFCMLLALALVVYVFSTNSQGGGWSGLLHPSTAEVTRYAGTSATAFLRWLPMTFFLLIAAQRFSERESVPLSAISWIIRRRRPESAGAGPRMDLSYPYFMVCLFSSGIHANELAQSYFWGQAALIGWALWPLRSRRFGVGTWLLALAAAFGLGFSGQRGMGELQQLLAGYDAQWLAGFLRQRTDPSQSATAIGQIGRIKLSARIVIRLEPKTGGAPAYLREASYRVYQPRLQTWFSGGSRTDFSRVPHVMGSDSTWMLASSKTNTSVVAIASYLDGRARESGDPEGLLPLPPGSRRLENLPVFSLQTNNAGAALASGLGLVMFDAYFAPGATFDSPPDTGTNHLDLTVPSNEVPALDRVIAGMKISDATGPEKLLAVKQFFATNFSYNAWLGPDKAPRDNETALSRFLLVSRSGHCEYFATATVLLLRQLGIPARYAVGYAVHEPSGRGLVVRERDAHAWCLVWNERAQTWEDFDTTPASWVAAEGRRAPATQWLTDGWSWLRFQIAKLRWGQANLRQYILWALIPVLGLLLYQILFRRGRGRRLRLKIGNRAPAISWPGLDSEFYLLERKLAARGVPRQPSEALTDWLARALADPALAGLREPIRGLLPLHYGHRFNPRGLSGPEREALAREVKTCMEALSRLESRSQRPV